MISRATTRRILAVAVWTVFVVVLLTLPGDEIPDLDCWVWLDKPVHALLFGIHFALLVRALAGWRGAGGSVAVAALGSGLFALLMEAVQLHLPGRGWEWWDLLAGLAGIVFAALLLAGSRATLPGLR